MMRNECKTKSMFVIGMIKFVAQSFSPDDYDHDYTSTSNKEKVEWHLITAPGPQKSLRYTFCLTWHCPARKELLEYLGSANLRPK